MPTFSERIRHARQQAKLTQKALADAVGLSRVAITQWEKGGIQHIRPENLFSVAKELNVDAQWLALGGKNTSSRPKHTEDNLTSLTTANLSIETLRQALPYIHTHQGKTFVIHLPDTSIFSPSFHNIVHDLTLLTSLGIRIVLVHGAKYSIDNALKAEKTTSLMPNHWRVTHASMLPIIQQAVGTVKLEIEAHFSMGAANTPMSQANVRIVSGNLITAQPIGVIDGVDYGSSGKVRRLDTPSIEQYLSQQQVVLLSPIGYSASGERFNLSSVELAKATAERLNADKLIYLSEHAIDCREKSLPIHLSLHDAKKIDYHPMQTLLLHACQKGVNRGHILNSQIDGALLTETLTRDGCGLMISSDAYESVRQAQIGDISGIMEILIPLEKQGVLVPRSQGRLEQDIPYFYVIEKEGMIMGCAALHPYAEEKTAELAGLATHTAYQRLGYGDTLLRYVEKQAKQQGIHRLFLLTTQSMQWFTERGFSHGSTNDLPAKRHAFYNPQRGSKVMLKPLLHHNGHHFTVNTA